MRIRRTITSAVMTYGLFLVSLGFSDAQVATPNAKLDGKQPDQVLFERALKAMKNAQYVVARALLETVINSHRDSDYVPRAKLSIDAWYAEGNFKQAEVEYRDFITFFPNRPEVGEAQLKIDSVLKKDKF
jgi:outer membrane protein assembly factor BamD